MSFAGNARKQLPPLLGLVGMAIALPPPTITELIIDNDMFVTRLSPQLKVTYCEPRLVVWWDGIQMCALVVLSTSQDQHGSERTQQCHTVHYCTLYSSIPSRWLYIVYTVKSSYILVLPKENTSKVGYNFSIVDINIMIERKFKELQLKTECSNSK